MSTSMYCTLPRGPRGADRWQSTVTSDSYEQFESQSAANYVDDLFDPILRDASTPTTICATIRSAQSNPSISSQQMMTTRANQQLAAPRLYYAVDSFADLKAIRRSSIGLDALP